MPSTFPEAFGMVAAEAAACGALPVVAGHSGMAEVARSLAAAVARAGAPVAHVRGRPAARRRSSPTDLASWLEAPGALRAATREAIVGVARERYSWDGVARTVIAAADGRLDDLPAAVSRRAPRTARAAAAATVGCRAMSGGRVRASPLLAGASPRCVALQRLRAQGRRRQPRQRQEAVRRRSAAPATRWRAPARRASSARTSTRRSQQSLDRTASSARTFEGIVHRQILYPNRDARSSTRRPASSCPAMPAELVTGEDAEDVAAYVAQAAAKPGEDTGRARAGRAAEAEGTRQGAGRHARRSRPTRPARSPTSSAAPRRPPARSRSTPRTTPRSPTTSRSRATASPRRARSSRTAAPRRSRPTSSPASTRSTAPCPATARAAWRASSPSSRRRAAASPPASPRPPRRGRAGCAALPEEEARARTP